jgi:hypothetical protein
VRPSWIATFWADAGVPVSATVQHLGSIAGDSVVRPVLARGVVMKDRRKQAATTVLDLRATSPQRLWHCACSETVEGGFDHSAMMWHRCHPPPDFTYPSFSSKGRELFLPDRICSASISVHIDGKRGRPTHCASSAAMPT